MKCAVANCNSTNNSKACEISFFLISSRFCHSETIENIEPDELSALAYDGLENFLGDICNGLKEEEPNNSVRRHEKEVQPYTEPTDDMMFKIQARHIFQTINNEGLLITEAAIKQALNHENPSTNLDFIHNLKQVPQNGKICVMLNAVTLTFGDTIEKALRAGNRTKKLPIISE